MHVKQWQRKFNISSPRPVIRNKNIPPRSSFLPLFGNIYRACKTCRPWRRYARCNNSLTSLPFKFGVPGLSASSLIFQTSIPSLTLSVDSKDISNRFSANFLAYLSTHFFKRGGNVFIFLRDCCVVIHD